MKGNAGLFRLPIGSGDTDASLLRLGQIIGGLTALFVLVAGLLKVSRMHLTDAQLFGAVQQVVQRALLFWIAALLMHPKTKPT